MKLRPNLMSQAISSRVFRSAPMLGHSLMGHLSISARIPTCTSTHFQIFIHMHDEWDPVVFLRRRFIFICLSRFTLDTVTKQIDRKLKYSTQVLKIKFIFLLNIQASGDGNEEKPPETI